MQRRDSPFCHVDSGQKHDNATASRATRDHRDQANSPASESVAHTSLHETFEPRPTNPAERGFYYPFKNKPQSQAALIDVWMSARPRLSSLRDLILVTRTKLKKEKYQCDQQEESFERIMEAFMLVLDTLLGSSHTTPNRDTLNRLAQELKRCRLDIRSLRAKTATLEDVLSNHEYQLQRIEEDVYRDLDQELHQGRIFYGMGPSQSFARNIAPSPPSTEKLLGLRDQLYSRMGDLRIYFERLNNFEFDLREQLEERDLLRAAGEVDMSTDAQFFEQSQSERKRIERELDEAHTEIHELKQCCFQENIEFEEPEYSQSPYDLQAEDANDTLASSGLQSQAQQVSSSIIGAFFTAQDRIDQWLEEPSDPLDSGEETKGCPRRSRRESLNSVLEATIPPCSPERAASTRVSGGNGTTAKNVPQRRSYPSPGSPPLESLSLESASTPLNLSLRPAPS